MKMSVKHETLCVVGNKTLSKRWSSLSLEAFHFLRSQTNKALFFFVFFLRSCRWRVTGWFAVFCAFERSFCVVLPWQSAKQCALVSGSDPDRGRCVYANTHRCACSCTERVDVHPWRRSFSLSLTHTHHANLNSKAVCKQIVDIMGLFSVQTISC